MSRLKHTFLCTVLILYSTFASSSISVPSKIQGILLTSGKPFEHSFKESTTGTVLVFLSVKCPCSNSHESAMNQLSKEFEKKGFRFIGIHSNADESFTSATEHFKKSELLFPVIQDVDSKIADQLEAFKTPHAYIISPQLEILFQGGVDNSKVHAIADQHYLREALSSLEKGLPVSDKNVRVLGCEIKRPE